MKSKVILAAGALLASQSVFALDFNGYFRANAGSNSEHGGQACFQLAGATKYRLGNECGVYGEVTFGQEVAKTDDGSVFKANVMLAIINGNASDPSLSKGTGEIKLPQVYISAANVPELGGASAWMGRRYYKREDLHITDFFYWNPSGMGAGLEDLPVGNGLKFSYALLRDDQNANMALNTGSAATRHDFQLRGLKVNEGGQLEFGLSLARKDANSAVTANSGNMFTVQHRQAGIFGGENKFAVQVGSGASANINDGSATGNGSDTRRTRLVEGLYFQPTAKFGGQLVAVYQKDTGNGNPDTTWTTLGGRIAYGITQHIKLLADLGQDRVAPQGGDTRKLTKFTVAAALSAGPGYYSRPELRLFYTHASWNDAARAAAAAGDALSATGVFGQTTSGSVIGVTAETWW